MEHPLVSCIMPTANRQKFIPYAINYFLEQDYPHKELIIIDDGNESIAHLLPKRPDIYYMYDNPLGTLGIKRNIACEQASGDIIMHWDDDDYYAPAWISTLINGLLLSNADIVGLNKVLFYLPRTNQKFLYEDSDINKPWLCGATMTYWKSFWEKHAFADLQIGEDLSFIWNTQAKVFAVDYLSGYVSIVHPRNTSLKPMGYPEP